MHRRKEREISVYIYIYIFAYSTSRFKYARVCINVFMLNKKFVGIFMCI